MRKSWPRCALLMLMACVLAWAMLGCVDSATGKQNYDQMDPETSTQEAADPSESQTEPENAGAESTEESTDPEQPELRFGIVTSTYLNVRPGPGTEYAETRALSYGDRVSIYASEVTAGGEWANIGEGEWVSMSYLYVEGTENQEQPAYEASVTGVGVSIRLGPGAMYDLVDVMSTGEALTVFCEFTDNSGMTWGCLGPGRWINLDYTEKASA